jgi:large subunit ribosomal protein L9
MEVILKEDVANVGFRGEVVKVADGYARNYLLPRKLAMQATAANKAVIEQMKASAARRSATEKAQAEELMAKLEPVVLSFTRKAGEHGHLFGSVTSSDIAAALAAQGFEVDRRKIQLGDAIKGLGDFKVAIRLHREVTARVTVKVQAEVVEGEVPAASAARRLLRKSRLRKKQQRNNSCLRGRRFARRLCSDGIRRTWARHLLPRIYVGNSETRLRAKSAVRTAAAPCRLLAVERPAGWRSHATRRGHGR